MLSPSLWNMLFVDWKMIGLVFASSLLRFAVCQEFKVSNHSQNSLARLVQRNFLSYCTPTLHNYIHTTHDRHKQITPKFFSDIPKRGNR